jgi:hypothetical protein
MATSHDLASVDALIESVHLELAGLLAEQGDLSQAAKSEPARLMQRLIRRARQAATDRTYGSGATASASILTRLLAVIDQETERALTAIANAHVVLSGCEITYTAYPSGRHDLSDVYKVPFAELPFMDDLSGAIRVQRLLRELPVNVQAHAAEAEHLREKILMVDRTIAADQDASKERLQWLRRTRTGLVKKLAAASSKTEVSACDLVRDAWEYCANSLSEFPPVAVALSGAVNPKALVLAAACLESMRECCWIPFSWERDGSDDLLREAELAWFTLAQGGWCLGVLASWVRALAAVEHPARCDLCYRRRATRRRCRCHKSSGGHPPEVVRAQRLFESYLHACGRVRHLGLKLVPAQEDGQLGEWVRSLPGLSIDFQAHALRLGRMLPSLEKLLGAPVSADLHRLFRVMVESVARIGERVLLAGKASGRQQASWTADAERFLRVSSFLTHFYAEGVPPQWSQFGIRGLERDADHPMVKSDAFSLPVFYEDAYRHHAWWDVVYEDDRKVEEMSLTRENVLQVKERMERQRTDAATEGSAKQVSHRDLARAFDCSHTAIRNALNRAGPARPRRRGR